MSEFISKEDELINLITTDQEDAAILLIDNCDIRFADDRGFTLLMIACEYGLSRLALKIISMGADTAYVSPDNITALLLAIDNNIEDVCIALIKTGNCNAGVIWQNDTALLLSCKRNILQVSLLLINENDANIAYVTNTHDTALIISCTNNQEVAIKIVKKILKNNSIHDKRSAIAQINDNNMDALWLAVDHNMVNLSKLLLKLDYNNPGLVANTGNTPLIMACIHNYTATALNLLKTGRSNPGFVNIINNTALIIACKNSNTQIALAIIKTNDANIMQTNNAGFTALYFAQHNNLTQLANTISVNILPKNIHHNMSTYNTNISQIKAQIFARDITKLPVELQHNADVLSIYTPNLNIPEFIQIIQNAREFCHTSADGINAAYVKQSIEQLSDITIILSTPSPENILIGFTTIKFYPHYLYIDTLCGDATFQKISNILIGIVEALCVLSNKMEIRLKSVPDKVSLYQHMGFLIDPLFTPSQIAIKKKLSKTKKQLKQMLISAGLKISDGLIAMTNSNHFNHTIPLNQFNTHKGIVTRRKTGLHTGRSPIDSLSPVSPLILTPPSPVLHPPQLHPDLDLEAADNSLLSQMVNAIDQITIKGKHGKGYNKSAKQLKGKHGKGYNKSAKQLKGKHGKDYNKSAKQLPK